MIECGFTPMRCIKRSEKNGKLFFNAPLAIFITTPNPINSGLASSNMELF